MLALLPKCRVGAAFYDCPSLQNDDLVAVTYGTQPVCNHDAGTATRQKSLSDQVFGFCIKCAGGLIKNQYARVVDQRPGDLQSLPLAAGKVGAAFYQLAIESARHGKNRVEYLCIGTSAYQSLFLDGRVPQGQIVPHGSFKQEHFLTDDCKRRHHKVTRDSRSFMAVNADNTSPGLVKAADEMSKRCFPGAAATNQCQAFTRSNVY